MLTLVTTALPNRFQEAFGHPAERSAGKVRDHLHPWVRAFVEAAPFVVLSTADADGRCDASPKGGPPGFVSVLDDRRLLLPDIAGNRLFQSFANIDANPHVGLLFLLPGVDDVARVNGRATVLDAEAVARHRALLPTTEEGRGTIQGLLIEVEEAYGHCPRALAYSFLWDVDRIAVHRADRPIDRRPPGV